MCQYFFDHVGYFLGQARLPRARELTLAALLGEADRLEAALREESAGGPALEPGDQPWRDYPPAFRLLSQLTAQGLDPPFQQAPAAVAAHVFTLGYPELAYQRLVARQTARVTWL